MHIPAIERVQRCLFIGELLDNSAFEEKGRFTPKRPIVQITFFQQCVFNLLPKATYTPLPAPSSASTSWSNDRKTPSPMISDVVLALTISSPFSLFPAVKLFQLDYYCPATSSSRASAKICTRGSRVDSHKANLQIAKLDDHVPTRLHTRRPP